MQRGTIIKHHGSWCLRYYDTEIKDGKRVRVKAFKKLIAVQPGYLTKRSVEPLAWKVLEPVNEKRLQPESAQPCTEFIEQNYLPFVKLNRRASTYKDYKKDVYERHCKGRLGDLRIRDFRTVHAQKLIAQIAKDNPELGHKTLQRCKAFLSGVFAHALREGLIDGSNPVSPVSVPGRSKKFKGDVYTLDEIVWMQVALQGVAQVAIGVAAFAGLRLSEIRGLQWQDYDGSSLTIRRTVWRTKIGDTKTESSEATVPCLPILQKLLNEFREKQNDQQKGKGTAAGVGPDWIFRGLRAGQPLNLANLARRTIIPAFAAFNAKEVQALEEQQREMPDGLILMQTPRKLVWRGWHAFRRGLASNLYGLGVKPKVIQAILRHSDIGTTLKYYVEVPDAEAREALNEIAKWIAEPE